MHAVQDRRNQSALIARHPIGIRQRWKLPLHAAALTLMAGGAVSQIDFRTDALTRRNNQVSVVVGLRRRPIAVAYRPPLRQSLPYR